MDLTFSAQLIGVPANLGTGRVVLKLELSLEKALPVRRQLMMLAMEKASVTVSITPVQDSFLADFESLGPDPALEGERGEEGEEATVTLTHRRPGHEDRSVVLTADTRRCLNEKIDAMRRGVESRKEVE